MKGSQEPRIRVEPKRKSTDGTDAGLLMQEYGCSLDRWQQDIIDCWLGKDKAGNYTVTSAGLAVPRQNGKNICLEAREFFGMVVGGERILHTAHQVRTSKKSFRRLEAIFTNKRHPEIGEIVKNIRYTNGEECIELDNGGSIEFSARSRQAARGFDGISLVVFDEAQELTEDQLEAIMATLAASSTGTRQLIYTGTPPYPGCHGTVFRRRRNGCLKDPGKHDAWHEWSVVGEQIEDINVSDTSLWYMSNPALGIHLTEEFTAEELRTMSPDGFARERLGWWAPFLEAAEPAIDREKWEACATNKAKPKGKTAFGVKFSADGAEVCLAGAVIGEKETRVELIARKSMSEGVQWLADWLAPRSREACCVVIDGRNGVDVLIDKISDSWKYKSSKIKANSRDVIAATGMITDAVIEGTLTWYSVGQDDLNESALTSTKRPIGQQGWGFGGENATPIEAAALALYGARTSKRNPQKKMRVG